MYKDIPWHATGESCRGIDFEIIFLYVFVQQSTYHRMEIDKQNSRILIVDDDNDFRRLTAALLEEEGFAVDQASGGSDGIDAARNRYYDLILLDVKMPGMDGIEVLKILRRDTPTTEIMMVTGYQDISLAVETLKLGAKEYLTKPVDPSDLVRRIQTILRVKQADDRVRELQANFTSRLLFELRSPLRSAKTALEFLSRGTAGGLTDQQYSILRNIALDLERMYVLLNDMIDLTKFEAGHVEIEKLPTNIDGLIPSICERMEPHIKGRKLALNVDIQPNIPTLQLDPDKIEQVVTNLIDNAIKYTEEGGSITISASSGREPGKTIAGDFVKISVSDTGAGIASEELPFIFEKYKEVLTGITSRQKTTGLGLAICRAIVEAHKGSMAVESTVGKGTTFSFYLPVDG